MVREGLWGLDSLARWGRWTQDGEGGGARCSPDPRPSVSASACKSLALSAGSQAPLQSRLPPTKDIQMRDKYLSPEIKPSPASSASSGCPGGSQALIWALIGFHLEICMLSMPASDGRPVGASRGSPRAYRQMPGGGLRGRTREP